MPAITSSINFISRCMTLYRSEKLKDEIAGAYHLYVYAICNKPGRSQDELSRDLFVHKSSVARAIAYLEERGLIERKNDECDKRISRVYPTERMLSLLPRVREISKSFIEQLTDGISEEELELFDSVLKRMKENASRAAKEDSTQ